MEVFNSWNNCVTISLNQYRWKWRIKKILICFLFFLIWGCDSISGTTLTDNRGKKYTFKDVSVTCDKPFDMSLFCEGLAIKKVILEKKYIVKFQKYICVSLTGVETNNGHLVFAAAKNLANFNFLGKANFSSLFLYQFHTT